MASVFAPTRAGIKSLDELYQKHNMLVERMDYHSSGVINGGGFGDVKSPIVPGVIDATVAVYDGISGKRLKASTIYANWFNQSVATTGTPTFASATIGGVPIPSVFNVTNHYSGFPDRTATSIGFNDGTYTFTLTATADPIWINAVPYTINTLTKALTVAQEAVSGLYWFWLTQTSGTVSLNCSITHPGFDKCLVATVYWNTTTNKGILSDERHWMGRDHFMHEYLHETIGARYANGLAGTFADTTFSIGTGEFYDEDIEHIFTSPLTTAKVLYHNGDSTWAWDELTTPYKVVNPGVDGNLRYNNGTALATADNNKYVNQFVFITGDISHPVHIIIGTTQHTLISDARLAPIPSLGALTSAESKLIYRITYRNVGGTPDYIESIDYRSVSNEPIGSYIPTDHGTLTGLTDLDHPASAIMNTPAGTIASTNVQDALNELDGDIQALVEDVLVKTNTVAYTPTTDYHPATKKYVDDLNNLVDTNDSKVYEINLYQTDGYVYFEYTEVT